MTTLTIGLVGSWLVGVNLFLANSQLGHVVLFLARHGFHLIPSALWLGAALIVALWLGVLYMAWHN